MSEHDFFAGRLVELRQAAGLSQAELGRRSGLPRQLVRKYELGESLPSWDRAVALADALGVEVCQFRESPHEQS